MFPDQRALPIRELARAGAIYAYSFILTNLDVSTPDKAVAAEHWYRHRTTVENIFRDSKHGAALRHLPSGYPRVNLAWMWGALLAATMAAWLHQLTTLTTGEEILAGHGVRGGKAMIATLRWRLIAVPGLPAHPPRPPADPAAAARPAPARRDPRPAAGTARPSLTRASEAAAPRPGPSAHQPEPHRKPPPSRTRARHPGHQPAPNPKHAHQDHSGRPGSAHRYSRNRVRTGRSASGCNEESARKTRSRTLPDS